jgi:hypothetical protein
MDQSRAPSLLEFWRRPRLATGRFAPLRISEWIGWLCLMVVLSFIAEAIGYLMLHLLGHAIPNDRFINHMASHPSWRFAALLLVAPVLEELTFRCFLTESPRAMAVGMGFFGAFLIGLLIHGLMALAGKHFLSTQDIAWHYFINLAIALPIIAVQAGVAWFFRRGLLRALRRYAAWAFWISALLFAAAHSFNFGLGFKDWLLWLTLPQLMVGLVLAYLRVRYGLRWSIATHLAFDWILVLLLWTHHDATTMGLPMKLLAGVFSLLLLAMIVRRLFFLFRRGVLRTVLPEEVAVPR